MSSLALNVIAANMNEDDTMASSSVEHGLSPDAKSATEHGGFQTLKDLTLQRAGIGPWLLNVSETPCIETLLNFLLTVVTKVSTLYSLFCKTLYRAKAESFPVLQLKNAFFNCIILM